AESFGVSCNEAKLALLRNHKQQVLVGQENELSAAETTAFPLASAVFGIDASEYTAVETERVTIVDHEIIEVRFQSVRGPDFFDNRVHCCLRFANPEQAHSFVGADEY